MNTANTDTILNRYRMVYRYVDSFWKELTEKPFQSLLRYDIVPLIITEEYIRINEDGTTTMGLTQKIPHDKIWAVAVTISIHPDLTDEQIKGIIRHELIHYGLMMKDLKSDDKCAIFKILCEIYDAPYHSGLGAIEQSVYDKIADQIKDCFTRAETPDEKAKLSLMVDIVGNTSYDCDMMFFLFDGLRF